jgi:hypothetical protein
MRTGRAERQRNSVRGASAQYRRLTGTSVQGPRLGSDDGQRRRGSEAVGQGVKGIGARISRQS